MIATRCSYPSCKSRKIIYRNAVFSIADGLQVEFAVCSKHSAWEYRIEARLKAEKKLRRLKRARENGKRLIEETCLLCLGKRQINDGKCWHCGGRGRVISGYDSVNPIFAK